MENRAKKRVSSPESNPADRLTEKGLGTGGRRLPRGGRLFGPVFGLLWLVYPVGALLASDPSLALLGFALSGTALFAAIFLWLLWLHDPLQDAAAEASEVRKRRAAVATLAALAIALTLVCGNEWLTLFIHTSIAAGLLLPGRNAYMAIAGLVISIVALGRVSGWEWFSIGRFALIASALGLWITAFARNVVTIAQLRAARKENARLAVAEERLRFARDLHDLLGHSLSLIALKSELAGRLLPTAPEKAAAEVHDIEGVARKALREVRDAVAGYRQPTLAGELDSAREMLKAAGIGCRVENEAGTLPNAADAILAWAVREGVTNVIRHSYARGCEIRVKRNGEEARAEVTDDGGGFLPEPNGTSFTGSGLSGLAERVTASGGGFEANSLPEGGFGLRVSLPLREGDAPYVEPGSRGSSTSEDGRR